MNGLLYVVGGDDGSCNLASVEYYNPSTDKWTLLPTSMSTGRSYAGKQAVGEWAAVGSSVKLRVVPPGFCMFYVDLSRRNFHQSGSVNTSLVADLWLFRMIVATWQPRSCSYHNCVCLFLQQVWL